MLLLLLKSGGLAFAVAVLSSFSGLVLGAVLYKTGLRSGGFFRIVLLIPLFLSPYIIAVAWKDLFFLLFSDTGVLSSFFGVVLVLTSIYTPLAMLITGSALTGIDSPIEESALMVTNIRSAFFKVILPLIKPALFSSFVLIFIFSISQFSVPAFFGVRVFTTEIFTQFSAFYNHTLAVLQSSVLIIICILLLLGEKNYLADAPFFAVGSKGTKTRIYKPEKHKYLLLSIPLFWFFISVILPFAVLFIQAFGSGSSYIVKAFTLLKPTFATSFLLAFGGAAIALLTGLIAALSSAAHRKKHRDYFSLILLITFATPSIIFGISLIKFYNHPAFNFIYSSFAIILIGYAGKFTFISTKLIENSLKQIPRSLDEAAQIAGIPSFTRFRKITMPMIYPALFGAFIISFIFNLGELGTTIMLYPPGTEIMPIKVYTIMANAPQALTSSMTLIVFSVTLILIAVFYFAGKKLMHRIPAGY
jgi:ABC-type Fe3+ transport system permease subunit